VDILQLTPGRGHDVLWKLPADNALVAALRALGHEVVDAFRFNLAAHVG